ncbi:MAG: M18 family aminopeptidase [Planctomycetes bacterium]|nr:M18 family aminopeptidase [Planctomycetota bacterium]
MSTPATHAAVRMAEFIDASPSPYHACRSAAALLETVGFTRLAEVDAWTGAPGAHYVVRGGSLVAWCTQEHHRPWSGFRVLGAHTDSPNLRVKPRPDRRRSGFAQLGVEVYGGVLLNSWLDRDLGLSGRAHVRASGGVEERLFLVQRPLLKIPQLAIHLDREIHTDGLKLNKQTHMSPVWSTLDGDERGFVAWLASELDVDEEDVLAWDAMVHDTNPSCLFGQANELVSAPRLDNLCSSFCALTALAGAVERGAALEYVPVVSLFDHEEVGSGSAAGAESPLLRGLLERTVLARGGTREEFHRAVADSLCVSIDMAHATHPNYADKHDPEHEVRVNAGPVIKLNSNMRYASESESVARFQLACERADVPCQKWVMRSDLACGSTIGPLTAQNLGMLTVDVGNPQLGMHSCRETCGSKDPGYLLRALGEILQ